MRGAQKAYSAGSSAPATPSPSTSAAPDSPAPTATASSGTYTARALLDVSALQLAPGQRRLAVQVRVRDNRPPDYDGPGVGLSEVFFVTLDEKAKSLADQVIDHAGRKTPASLFIDFIDQSKQPADALTGFG